MGQQSNERLRAYLGQLSPRSHAMLMRQFEEAVARGEEPGFSALVLEQLRRVARATDEAVPRGRTDEAARLVFQPLEPFLVDGRAPLRPGQVRRASLMPIWHWLVHEGAPGEIRSFEDALAVQPPQGRDEATRKLQRAVADALFQMALPSGPDHARVLAKIGGPDITDDLLPIGSVLLARDALQTLGSRLPPSIRSLDDSRIGSACDALGAHGLQAPQVLPFALSLVTHRLAAPWQVIRVAIRMAASDDEPRVAATPFGMAVTIALHDLFGVVAGLRENIRRGRLTEVADTLKPLHDGVRALRTELDLRQDSKWGKQLAAIRAEISDTLRAEIETVPGRVRRILRQRSDKDILAGARIDGTEVDETAALIEFLAACRTYAGELAVNEVTLRTFSDLQHHVERATEVLVQALRGADGKTRAYRQLQARAAVRFCEALFGRDYAALMGRAVDNALADEPSAHAG